MLNTLLLHVLSNKRFLLFLLFPFIVICALRNSRPFRCLFAGHPFSGLVSNYDWMGADIQHHSGTDLHGFNVSKCFPFTIFFLYSGWLVQSFSSPTMAGCHVLKWSIAWVCVFAVNLNVDTDLSRNKHMQLRMYRWARGRCRCIWSVPAANKPSDKNTIARTTCDFFLLLTNRTTRIIRV